MSKYRLNWEKILEVVNLLLVERIKEEAPVHDGELRQSISGISGAHDIKIYMVPWGLYTEFGTLPHPMNPEWLRKWCRDVLGDEDARFAVAYYIAKHGTQPHPFIRPILDMELRDIFKQAIISIGEDAVMLK